MSGSRSAHLAALPIDRDRSDAAAAASSEAFDRFFAEHFAYVVHNLRRLGVCERDVDDVAQEVFVAVHRRFEEYDPRRAARAWLFAFISRTAANHRNLARHRRQRGLEDVPNAASGDDPESNAEQSARSRLVREVLLAMTEDRRTALILHDLDGLTAPEIAHALAVPLNTVYSRVRRAREDFKRIAQARLAREDA